MNQLNGKVALLTGATSGIGAMAARALSAEGAAVVLAGRRLEEGERVAEEIRSRGGEARFIQTDVTVEAQVARLVEETLQAHNRLDIAFNNAGGNQSFGPLETISAESFAKDLTVNLSSVFYSIKHEIPAMRHTGGGCIINTASTAGVKGVESIAGYVAAKHGVIGLTRTAALELARHHIRVNALVLGPTASESWRARIDAAPGAMERVTASVPLGRVASMDEIASMIVFLASDSASFITGAALPIDGGVTAR